MNHEKHEKHEKTRKKKAATEHTEMGFEGLVGLFEQTHVAMQSHAARAVNSALVVRNWLFGWYISEYEKQSKDRSEIYGKKLMGKLSKTLTFKLGKGFSRRTLDQFRQFYEHYQKIRQTTFAESFDELKNAVQRLLETQCSDKEIGQMLSAKSLTQKPQTLSEKLSVARIGQTLSAKLPLSWSHYLFLMGISNIPKLVSKNYKT